MRCTKSVKSIFIFLLFSVMNFRVFLSAEDDFDRGNIIEDLRSLLGLNSQSNGTPPTKNPFVNIDFYTSSMSPFYTSTTSSSVSTNTPTPNSIKSQLDNNSTISNNNETFNASISNNSITNLTSSNSFNTNITDITNLTNITDITNLTNITDITNLTNITDITNLTNITGIANLTNNTNFTNITNLTNNTNFTNITNITNNNSSNNTTNSEIKVSTNDSLSSSNSTALNESASFTKEPAIDDRDTSSTTIMSLDEVTIKSSSPLVHKNNETIQEFLARQNNTGSSLPSNKQTSNNSASTTSDIRCSVLPTFTETCMLPKEYINQSDSLTTFADVEHTLSNSYLQNCLQRYCYSGEWCLGTSMDSFINDSLNFPTKFCSSTFLSCLKSTAAEYGSCANYKKFRVISDSLELICKYRQLAKTDKKSESCGFHLMKLILVLLSDLKEDDSIETDNEFSCYSQTGYLMVSFNCLLNQCSDSFNHVLTEFDSWKWFTENRTMAYRCPPYYECASTTTFWNRLSIISSTEYRRWRGMTAKTSLNYETSTKVNGLVDTFKDEIENEENPPSGSHPFGDTVAANSHIMASLSAMIVILTIGMSVLMVVCWRHLKKYSSRKRGGYSKLKTGEC